MSALNWIEVEAFALSCSRVGVEPPESIAKALHLVNVANAFIDEPSGPILGMTDAKMRERITAVSVRTHNAGNPSNAGMRPGRDAVLDALSHELREHLMPELDSIITELQPRFAEAAGPLEVAAREFGIESMTSSDEIIDRSDYAQAVVAWREMREGWAKLFPLVQWRIRVSQVFRCGPTHDQVKRAGFELLGDDTKLNYSVLFASGEGWSLDPDRLHVQGDRRQNLDWLSLARSGLRLNTVSDVDRMLKERGLERVPSTSVSSVTGGIDADLDALSYNYPPTG